MFILHRHRQNNFQSHEQLLKRQLLLLLERDEVSGVLELSFGIARGPRLLAVFLLAVLERGWLSSFRVSRSEIQRFHKVGHMNVSSGLLVGGLSRTWVSCGGSWCSDDF
ncbi:unnamed protein product [Cuscuta epithymum]|uniref:Uncharacterized protein n=1 Tax=Cuscuta epithymum TaxID=186058 RepID=A0AAV0DBX0_9ASTE|nr:unnamed protein product [Cuscuta epithymum]